MHYVAYMYWRYRPGLFFFSYMLISDDGPIGRRFYDRACGGCRPQYIDYMIIFVHPQHLESSPYRIECRKANGDLV